MLDPQKALNELLDSATPEQIEALQLFTGNKDKIVAIVESIQMSDDAKEAIKAKVRGDIQKIPGFLGKLYNGAKELGVIGEDYDDGF